MSTPSAPSTLRFTLAVVRLPDAASSPTLASVVAQVRKIKTLIHFTRSILRQWKLLGDAKEVAKWTRALRLQKHALVMWMRLTLNRHCQHTRPGCQCSVSHSYE